MATVEEDGRNHLSVVSLPSADGFPNGIIITAERIKPTGSRHLKKMVEEKRLRLLYPNQPNHPDQAYLAVSMKDDSDQPPVR